MEQARSGLFFRASAVDNVYDILYFRRQEECIIENEDIVNSALALMEALKTKKLGRRQAASIKSAIIAANNILEKDPRYIYVSEIVGLFMMGLAVLLFTPIMIVSRYGTLASITFIVIWIVVVNWFGRQQDKIMLKLLEYESSYWVRKIFIPKKE